LDQDKAVVNAALQKAPNNYRKLVRLGSYGSWLNYYVCGAAIRVNDLQGRAALFPVFKQDGGRCGEP
jgi:phospholipid/cholesterol/gamma-HCH transport system substrate-binding protein